MVRKLSSSHGFVLICKQSKERAMNEGFTLVEIMVVVAVVGILASMLTPQVGNLLSKARKSAANGEVKNITVAMQGLLSDTGRSPGESSSGWMDDTSGRGLNNCRYGIICNDGYGSMWDGPYMMKAINYDPWNRDYYYDGHPNEWTGYPGGASFISAGENGSFECFNRSDLNCTADDIVIYLHK